MISSTCPLAEVLKFPATLPRQTQRDNWVSGLERTHATIQSIPSTFENTCRLTAAGKNWRIDEFELEFLEAPPGFEPGMEVYPVFGQYWTTSGLPHARFLQQPFLQS
jgi:hypothetical protein